MHARQVINRKYECDEIVTLRKKKIKKICNSTDNKIIIKTDLPKYDEVIHKKITTLCEEMNNMHVDEDMYNECAYPNDIWNVNYELDQTLKMIYDKIIVDQFNDKKDIYDVLVEMVVTHMTMHHDMLTKYDLTAYAQKDFSIPIKRIIIKILLVAIVIIMTDNRESLSRESIVKRIIKLGTIYQAIQWAKNHNGSEYSLILKLITNITCDQNICHPILTRKRNIQTSKSRIIDYLEYMDKDIIDNTLWYLDFMYRIDEDIAIRPYIQKFIHDFNKKIGKIKKKTAIIISKSGKTVIMYDTPMGRAVAYCEITNLVM